MRCSCNPDYYGPVCAAKKCPGLGSILYEVPNDPIRVLNDSIRVPNGPIRVRVKVQLWLDVGLGGRDYFLT